MRVKLCTGMVQGETTLEPGDIATLPDSEALAYIASGMATPVVEEREQAVEKQTEKREQRRK